MADASDVLGPWAHALAGTAGGMCAMTLLFPLDYIRTIQQVNPLAGSAVRVAKQAVAEGGWHRLYTGLRPVLLTIGISNFVYYGVYAALKRAAAGGAALSSLSAASFLGSAAVAGSMYETVTQFSDSIAACCSMYPTPQDYSLRPWRAVCSRSSQHLLLRTVLVTSPIWVVNTRMKLQKNNEFASSLWDGLRKIATTEGLAALWAGTLPSLVLVSNPAIQQAMYEQLRLVCIACRKRQSRELQWIDFFVMGAVSKLIATLCTYPMQVIQNILRAKNDGTAWEAVTRFLRQTGWQGLFRGLRAKIVQTVMNAAFLFLTYEQLLKVSLTLLKLVASDRGDAGVGKEL
eukprot:m.115654 g.115654  ORF g.115654 m.115654 type:complete len:345 (+) comp16355_c0_seq6:281-1315(+)